MATPKKPARIVKTGTPKASKKAAVKSKSSRVPKSTSVAVAKTPPKPPKTRTKPVRSVDELTRLREVVLKALDDIKARDVHEIDVRGKSSVTDLMIVVSGTSTRHVKSIADEVVKSAKKAGIPPIGVEGEREAEWVLVDLGDIVVHAMLPRTREFYGLERLWTVGDDEPILSEGVGVK